MCGIAGVIGSGGSARPMIEALTHRGPNGVFVEDAPDRSLDAIEKYQKRKTAWIRIEP